MDDQVEVIKSNKGGMKVIHKGYMYTVHKKRQCGGIRWRCAQRSLHCKGSISTGLEGPPKMNMPHNHLPDLHSVALARGRQAEDFGPVTQFLDIKFDEDPDSMPLQERLSKVAAQEKIAAGSAGPLKSQPLSPTKLKVTRQGPRVTKQVEPPSSPINEEMCLRWNSHHSNMQTAFPNILSKEQFVDVTLAAEGKTLKCHRLILSSCSPYFEEILSGISPFQHPVLFMRDIPFWILKSLCDFMYAGEVHIFQNKLEELLSVAEALKIKGLAGKSTPSDQTRPPKEKKKQDKSANQSKKNPSYAQSHYESTSQDYDDDLLDPLDLLEPLYEEAAEEKKPSTIVKPKENRYYQPVKKTFTRRLRKRKYSEQRDPSPPPVFSFRKGTRSRPNVKIPKYYHNDYSNTPKPTPNTQTDPLLEVDEIKTEPIDVEDNLIDYSDEDHFENSLEISNAAPSADQEKFKKIKLTKPIITEVHSIKEPTGGLEVIKITVQQPDEKKDDPLDGAVENHENGVSEDAPIEPPLNDASEAPVVEPILNDVSEPPIEDATVVQPLDDLNTPIEQPVGDLNETLIAVEPPTNDLNETPLEGATVETENLNEQVEGEALNQETEAVSEIRIESVRSNVEEIEQGEVVREGDMNHVVQEESSVTNSLGEQTQTGPPDIE